MLTDGNLAREPSPRSNSSTMDRLATMWPAARKVASSHLKIPGASLSSATPSPSLGRSLRTPELAATPKIPKRMITPKRGATPNIDLGIKRAGHKKVSTDDLLKIRLPIRKTAADLFLKTFIVFRAGDL